MQKDRRLERTEERRRMPAGGERAGRRTRQHGEGSKRKSAAAGRGQKRESAQSRRKKRRRARRRFAARAVTAILCFAVLAGLVWKGWSFLKSRREVDIEKLAREGYPESLLELLEKNPETKEFVLHYADYQGEQEIDVSGEVKEGEIPHFLQWDERWGYETYGNDFLAVTGCGPTCLSMVLCGLSGEADWNPLEVARWAQEQGYYVEGSGSSWELMSKGAESLGLIVSEVVFDEEHIRSALSEGTPIICVMGPGDFTTSGHFLVLTGLDEDGKVRLKDPNSRIRTEKTWELQELMGQMKNLWAYSL